MPEETIRDIAGSKSRSNDIRREDFERHVTDCIRGSLVAGAAGDALGYAVEFIRRDQILAKYGEEGITRFDLDRHGKALISDDTQMTLFTANGMLMGVTRGYMRGIGGAPEDYVAGAYIDWYYTQTGHKKETGNDFHYTWLRDLPELAHRRAPGITCLNACESLLQDRVVQNNSKGCGGIMRVAPMALLNAGYDGRDELHPDPARMAKAGAETARVTHKHPLAFLPAAQLTYLIYRLVPLCAEEAREQLVEIAGQTVSMLDEIYKERYAEDKQILADLTRKAIRLAQSDVDDTTAISALGEGWTGEEAWAIALFCAIRHAGSMSDAIIASVNHDGDSDSTGSICGNIMGAIYGYETIRRQRLFCPEGRALEETIELHDLILAVADDLATGCIISEYDPIDTPEKRQWYERYCEMKPAGYLKKQYMKG